jgi:cytochrome c-type biogenesis protein
VNDAINLGPGVAFLAGLLSFLSPCVLPLVPSYLGFLTGMTVEEMSDRRHWAFWHALVFVLGFSLVFVLLGAGATALGATLAYHKQTIARIGGVMLVIFGLYTMGAFQFGLFDRERRIHLDRKPTGFLGSGLVGMTFAAGWTPCLGPVLAGILSMAGATGDVHQGVVLLSFYSLGLAVPFLAAALAVDRFRGWFSRFRQWMPWVQRISGAILILVGLLLVSGEFTRLAAWLNSLTPDWLLQRV